MLQKSYKNDFFGVEKRHPFLPLPLRFLKIFLFLLTPSIQQRCPPTKNMQLATNNNNNKYQTQGEVAAPLLPKPAAQVVVVPETVQKGAADEEKNEDACDSCCSACLDADPTGCCFELQ
jgi:hypothetical protein